MNRNEQKRTEDPNALSRVGYFRIVESDWQRLSNIANAEQLSVSDVVRRAIREFLSRAAA
jgi:hypothetical protein